MANEFPLPKNSYAAFDSISLRNLIIERLNDQGLFTDQNYIGSNLSAIIDIISYTFNTLIFYLNKTSSESLFTEAQLYENINRIVSLIDYKPLGYQTSTLTFQVSAQNFNAGVYTIPRYSSLMVGKIPFSFAEDVTFNIISNQTLTNLSDISNKIMLYQGIYREFPTHTASGDPNEVITINVNNVNIDHFKIDVYVFEATQGRWVEYKNTANFYLERAFSRTFEKKLNSNLQYEIKFGDGINGRKLENGDKVIIFYLQSWGNEGIIGPNLLRNASMYFNPSSNFRGILNDITKDQQFSFISQDQTNNLVFTNNVGSTVPENVENADSIRKNAPSNFKSQYRLVTKQDYESYIISNFKGIIGDVRVFSNWDYTSDYLKYFNDIGISPTGFRQILFNQLAYADSCNFNNIYVCATPKISQGSTLKYLLPAQKEAILSTIKPLKTLTSEITFLDPIYKAVSFGVPSENETIVSDKDICRFRITRNVLSQRSAQSIAKDVEAQFRAFFDTTNIKIGKTFDYNELVRNILSIDGVNKIETVRLDTNQTYNGLSLFMWNPTYIDQDKQTVISNVIMRDFEITYFNDLDNISTFIEVVETQTFN